MAKTTKKALAKKTTGNGNRRLRSITQPETAGARIIGSFVLNRLPDGKNVARFGRGEWATGEVNGTIYIPKADAEGVDSITVTLNR